MSASDSSEGERFGVDRELVVRRLRRGFPEAPAIGSVSYFAIIWSLTNVFRYSDRAVADTMSSAFGFDEYKIINDIQRLDMEKIEISSVFLSNLLSLMFGEHEIRG